MSAYFDNSSVSENSKKPSAHDICGRKIANSMEGKPEECLKTELSIQHVPGDVYIITYPKTGTTVLQYMCHLLRTNCSGDEFEDIHQVCPHTSSAWFIGQDLNAPQTALPRLFKSHRELQQVAPFSNGIKYISTIRDPTQTLISIWNFRKERGTNVCDESLIDFARSRRWMESNNDGSVTNLFENLTTYWKCRTADNFLLLPFEDFVSNREDWLPIIAKFLDVPCTPELVKKVSAMTSKEAMLLNCSKFDESWCKSQRELLKRPHPKILRDSSKVTKGHGEMAKSVMDNCDIHEIQSKLWYEKVEKVTGIKSYEEMRYKLNQFHFPHLYETRHDEKVI